MLATRSTSSSRSQFSSPLMLVVAGRLRCGHRPSPFVVPCGAVPLWASSPAAFSHAAALPAALERGHAAAYLVGVPVRRVGAVLRARRRALPQLRGQVRLAHAPRQRSRAGAGVPIRSARRPASLPGPSDRPAACRARRGSAAGEAGSCPPRESGSCAGRPSGRRRCGESGPPCHAGVTAEAPACRRRCGAGRAWPGGPGPSPRAGDAAPGRGARAS